ncbi:T9SS type A sorting domain-containing protein [Cryomorpha ignava]|uniref:T9SS type A sorting domain-containing protein n=1 Tax=Cryomorpha ignava TaxID=101383 RepID=A0A7K3WSD1_9FLAO|nr:T9SS type A sorting domain-containing protein [Cryomorpha ignava]NEN24394.1 T9SS type A sorting domain-containing protein [Cryomorpha ignava]
MKLISFAFLILLLYPTYSNGQVQNNGNLRMHEGSDIGFFGDFTNNGVFTNNRGTLNVVGSNSQKFNGTSIIHANNLVINKASNSLQLDNELQIAGVLNFTKGLILTDRVDIDTEFVNFLDGATYTGASNTSHIDGVIRKTGKDAFVFPTGDNTLLRTIGILASGADTNHFTAYYIEDNPDGLYSRASLAAGLDHVSACEYWTLNRTGGNSEVPVTLSWASNSCGVDYLCDLVVSQWDGNKWTSAGNGGATGTAMSGTLISGKDCSASTSVKGFGPYTLGSISSFNPLPITLVSFEAQVCGNSVCLSWQTASEFNNDFFTVEKSDDALIWKKVEDVMGAGNSHTILNYKTIDNYPFAGLSYYRLKQTDFNGNFLYSSVESVHFKNHGDKGLIIYPNPARDNTTIKGLLCEVWKIHIYNLIGQEVTPYVNITRSSESSLQLDISRLKPGIYHVKTDNTFSSFIKQ